jgi:alpha-galactosidase
VWLHHTRLAGGGCHISDATSHINGRTTPLRFQALAGMMGSLSLGKNLPACTEGEIAGIRTFADLYKRIRHIPQQGELHRMASHREHPYAAFQYVTRDRKESLLFVFGHSMQFAFTLPCLPLHGLDPDARYEITELLPPACIENHKMPHPTSRPRSGRALMELGLRVELLGDYDARLLHFHAAPPPLMPPATDS